MPENAEIDGGRFFDWGRASQEYAKYRDIYPEAVSYTHLLKRKGIRRGGKNGCPMMGRNVSFPAGLAALLLDKGILRC